MSGRESGRKYLGREGVGEEILGKRGCQGRNTGAGRKYWGREGVREAYWGREGKAEGISNAALSCGAHLRVIGL